MSNQGSHRRRALLSALCMAILLLQSCYSLAKTRRATYVSSTGSNEALEISTWRVAGYVNSPPEPVLSFLTGIIVYPMDVLVSTGMAIEAAFDPDLDIQGGLFGAMGGILLPGITLFTIRAGGHHSYEIAPGQFDLVLLAAREANRHMLQQRLVSFLGPWIADTFETDVIRIVDRATMEQHSTPRATEK